MNYKKMAMLDYLSNLFEIKSISVQGLYAMGKLPRFNLIKSGYLFLKIFRIRSKTLEPYR